jgi:3-oxoacyl-[acyl-carrier-protein] synthase II
MMRRVVITGMGAVTPIGNTVEQLWKSVEEGKCGIEPITAFDTSEYRVKLAAQVKDLDVEQYFTKRDVKFNDRFTVFARVAAKQAIADSQLDLEAIDRTQLGVIVGSGIGGLASIENAKDNLNDKGPTRISPFFIPMTLINLAAGAVAIDSGANGHCSSIVTACAAGTDAIGVAFQKIRDGYATWMIAGGSEASITPLGVAGFMVMRALNEGEDPHHASIPFDENRSGFVMGEGSAIIILEELSSALARNAKIYGEIVGYGTTCDANHITAPLEDGSMGALAMTLAIKDAKLSPENVDYINAHGTSTPLNDKTETLAVKRAFGDHAYQLMMSSTKAMTGHMLGASGAVEAIISIKALQEGFVPATINLVNQDPLCDLDVVANVGRKKDIKVAMSNSLGFGGHNASIVLKKWEG